MRAAARKSGFNYLPVIQHDDGRKEVIYGDALATADVARKYAQLEINDRNRVKRMHKEDSYED